MTEPNPRFDTVLSAPLPDPASMSSSDRIARVTLYKEMNQAGVAVPEDHLRFGITLITMDRASRASEARSASKDAKKASGPVAMPSVDDL